MQFIFFNKFAFFQKEKNEVDSVAQMESTLVLRSLMYVYYELQKVDLAYKYNISRLGKEYYRLQYTRLFFLFML